MLIEKEDGTPFTTTDDSNQPLPIVQKESGTPVDFILHSMWSSVDIKLNNNLVSESGTNYMYKALLEAMLTYDDRTKKFNWLMKDLQEIQGILLKLIQMHLHLIMD